MPRIALFKFDQPHQGLYVAGPRERTPKLALRRAKAIHPVRESLIASRDGSSADTSILAAHSLGKLNGVRFQGATTILNRAGVSIKTGLDGTALFLEGSEPKSGTDVQFLFVAGGGELFKVSTAGTVSKWGIAAPTAGEQAAFASVANGPQAKTIDAFDSLTAPGTRTSNIDRKLAVGGAPFSGPATLALDTADKQEGTASLNLSSDTIVDVRATVYQDVVFTTPANLELFPSGDVSVDEDLITFWVQLGVGVLSLTNMNFALEFYLGSTNRTRMAVFDTAIGIVPDTPAVVDYDPFVDQNISEESV